MPEEGSTCWKFASAQFDERSLELRVAGEVVELEPRPLELLRHLLLHAGKVVTHDELFETVWQGRLVSESALEKCVSRLREVLRDADHAIVKTVHGYGYRLVPPVEIAPPGSSGASLAEAPAGTPAPVHSETRHCTALIVDIARTVALRSELGDAAAGRRIRHLLDSIIVTARQHGGEFIKSYGDDVLAIFEQDPVASAARVAIAAQRLAVEAGLQLYAGFHSGAVEFLQTMGHSDAQGLTVNIAARLHKLTEGAPGRIFITGKTVDDLPADLRAHATRYGLRDLKGIGAVDIWTLGWHEGMTTTGTMSTAEPVIDIKPANLVLRSGAQVVHFYPDHGPRLVGRGKECALRLLDPESRISSTHVLFECSGSRWFVQDISRNGTWLRDGRTGEETLLPYCTKALLPRSGVLCLGRRFADDAEGRFAVDFEISGHQGGRL